ncbi:hypothetical protein [Pseudomonas phage vB_Pa-PAC2]|nr:hypothetical protein ETTORE_0305 [Pseudomonas phage Ettore]
MEGLCCLLTTLSGHLPLKLVYSVEPSLHCVKHFLFTFCVAYYVALYTLRLQFAL